MRHEFVLQKHASTIVGCTIQASSLFCKQTDMTVLNIVLSRHSNLDTLVKQKGVGKSTGVM